MEGKTAKYDSSILFKCQTFTCMHLEIKYVCAALNVKLLCFLGMMTKVYELPYKKKKVPSYF